MRTIGNFWNAVVVSGRKCSQEAEINHPSSDDSRGILQNQRENRLAKTKLQVEF